MVEIVDDNVMKITKMKVNFKSPKRVAQQDALIADKILLINATKKNFLIITKMESVKKINLKCFTASFFN